MVGFYSCYNEARCKGYYYVAGFSSWFRLLSIIRYCGYQSHKPTPKLYLVSFVISLLSIFGEMSQASCMLFATDIVFVTETWLRKGKWHLILVKVGVELGCDENLCLKEAFYLILDWLFLRERLSQKFLLIFICLFVWMDDGNWSNMTFRSMTYFNAYAGMKSMMTCINLRID